MAVNESVTIENRPETHAVNRTRNAQTDKRPRKKQSTGLSANSDQSDRMKRAILDLATAGPVAMNVMLVVTLAVAATANMLCLLAYL